MIFIKYLLYVISILWILINGYILIDSLISPNEGEIYTIIGGLVFIALGVGGIFLGRWIGEKALYRSMGYRFTSNNLCL
tara:strand:- start:701 stop:937 length:237 start_codon:yes stop_codon:yes gene_type:complete